MSSSRRIRHGEATDTVENHTCEPNGSQAIQDQLALGADSISSHREDGCKLEFSIREMYNGKSTC